MKYTPGPWDWQDMGAWCLVGQYGMRPIILSARGRRGGTHAADLKLRDADRDLLIPFDPRHPDARLIAAAPDLLEATRAALVVLAVKGASSEEEDSAIAMAVAAIAKAEGKP